MGFLTLLFCGAVTAQTSGDDFPVISFNGYGSVGLAHSSESNADFVLDNTQKEGAGYSQSWSPHVDSRIGAQLTAEFNTSLSAHLQVFSQQRHDGRYRPEVEWANLKYLVSPDFEVRIGRVVMPTFLVSEYRRVGYALPWVRTPTELYSSLPNSSFDGVRFSYTNKLAESRNTFMVSLGKSFARLRGNVKYSGNGSWGITDEFVHGDLTLRASHFRGNQKVENFDEWSAVLDGYRSYGAEGVALAEKYRIDGKAITMTTAGFSYEPGKWFAMGEWGLIDFRSSFGKRVAWYLSSGYRLGKFTPYMTFAKASEKNNIYDPGLDSGKYDPNVIPLNAALNNVLIRSPEQKTISAGLRWDVAKNASLKFQYDYTDVGAGSYGRLQNRQSELEKGGHYSVFSVVLDFLF